MKTPKMKKMTIKTKKKTTPAKKRSVAPKSGLSGFMVVWRHTMDDIPVMMLADEEAAVHVAKTIKHKDAYKIARDLGVDCSTPVCFGYVEFVKGQAKNLVIVDRKDDA